MLTAIGLSLNFIGSIVLLGSDLKPIKQVLKRCDPVHYAYISGIKHVIEKSKDEELVDDNRAYPFDGPVYPDIWRWWPLSRFLDRHAEQDIPRYPEVDIRGGWFKINGEQLTFPEERIVQTGENVRLNAGDTLSLNVTKGLLYEARIARIYIYGVFFLALGFLLQLIDLLLF